jgi:hypothetical protein
MLLEADLVGATDEDRSHVHANRLAWNDRGVRKENFVSYDRFLACHWHHYNQTFTKGLGKLYSRCILHSTDESHKILILFSTSCLVGVLIWPFDP